MDVIHVSGAPLVCGRTETDRRPLPVTGALPRTCLGEFLDQRETRSNEQSRSQCPTTPSESSRFASAVFAPELASRTKSRRGCQQPWAVRTQLRVFVLFSPTRGTPYCVPGSTRGASNPQWLLSASCRERGTVRITSDPTPKLGLWTRQQLSSWTKTPS